MQLYRPLEVLGRLLELRSRARPRLPSITAVGADVPSPAWTTRFDSALRSRRSTTAGLATSVQALRPRPGSRPRGTPICVRHPLCSCLCCLCNSSLDTDSTQDTLFMLYMLYMLLMQKARSLFMLFAVYAVYAISSPDTGLPHTRTAANRALQNQCCPS